MNLFLFVVLISNLVLVLMQLNKNHIPLVLLWVSQGRCNQKPSINLWEKSQTFDYYRQTFSIFLTLPEDIDGYWNPSETHYDILKIYSQKFVIFIQICALFKYFLINLKEYSLVCSFLWFFFYLFLYKGVITACLRSSENVDNFMELLKIL